MILKGACAESITVRKRVTDRRPYRGYSHLQCLLVLLSSDKPRRGALIGDIEVARESRLPDWVLHYKDDTPVPEIGSWTLGSDGVPHSSFRMVLYRHKTSTSEFATHTKHGDACLAKSPLGRRHLASCNSRAEIRLTSGFGKDRTHGRSSLSRPRISATSRPRRDFAKLFAIGTTSSVCF
jgi:hypothetical protein